MYFKKHLCINSSIPEFNNNLFINFVPALIDSTPKAFHNAYARHHPI